MGVAQAQAPTWAETVLHNFANVASKGSNRDAGVIRDSAGNLYGTAGGGGKDYGVVFKVDPGGQETVLYAFTGGADGGIPYAGVIRDSAGNLYGTTDGGGTAAVTRAMAWSSRWTQPARRLCCTASRAGPMGAAPTQ